MAGDEYKVQSQVQLSPRERYNLVTDTVSGINMRWRDNVIQALAIGGSVVLGAAIGSLSMGDIYLGVTLGSSSGLLCGLFASGAAIGVYRRRQHQRGRHD